jgi:23S rRNA (uridine2552-2'-O)-methyltransferase
MGSQWRRDGYYSRAVKEGYRSRAAFKLKDIQNRFSVIRDDDNIVDLGAAPGSWMQVERELTSGVVLGVDLNPIVPIENTITIVGDFTTEQVQEEIIALVNEVNVVLCDASPKLSGQRSYDQARAFALAEAALLFACRVLTPGGNFVVKFFQGELFRDLLASTKDHFRSVRVYRAKASRKGSAEVYIIAQNFRRGKNGS